MKNHILLVDDNRFYLKAMKKTIEKQFSYLTCHMAENRAQALELCADQTFDLIICDLILPDSSDGSLIRQFVDEGRNVVVITDFADAMIRQKLVGYDIVDYIIKSDSDNFEYLVSMLERLELNKNRTVVIVNDDAVQRAHLASHLSRQNLNIIEASDGNEAMAILAFDDVIDLVITDHHMGDMTGLDLLRAIRARKSMQELPVIVLTGSQNDDLIARYLKSGANDFLKKPFSTEELMCRVAMLLSMKDIFDQIRKIAISDQLTGLHNRFYLYEAGEQLLKMARRNGKPVSLAIFDIDHFKTINDTYGHIVGDRVLIRFGSLLKKMLRQSDLIVRFGGEEFVVIMPETSLESAMKVCEKIRIAASKMVVHSHEEKFGFTLSAGVDIWETAQTLEALLVRADQFLYQAKEGGRNQVRGPFLEDILTI